MSAKKRNTAIRFVPVHPELQRAGTTDRKKVFHSFRHTYRDALHSTDISDQAVRALGGWSSSLTAEN
ncbi:hypothetical protein [Aquibium sp. ELW1220]|uniref:hypothetical protein n=1 Tax=Aquibium sp. ELW1220 TaxID=2976766 RepID=UPI0025AF374D|nr:hypothetical protein [Aquibium sp. ELW1220]MDN2582929.1 hypothetical protein [Aquibium sp. ELW1220]